MRAVVENLEAHHLDVLSYPTRYSCICQRSEPAGGTRGAGQARIEWPASARGYRSWAGHVAAEFAKTQDGALW